MYIYTYTHILSSFSAISWHMSVYIIPVLSCLSLPALWSIYTNVFNKMLIEWPVSPSHRTQTFDFPLEITEQYQEVCVRMEADRKLVLCHRGMVLQRHNTNPFRRSRRCSDCHLTGTWCTQGNLLHRFILQHQSFTIMYCIDIKNSILNHWKITYLTT